jgi:hypothetical protein
MQVQVKPSQKQLKACHLTFLLLVFHLTATQLCKSPAHCARAQPA